MYLLKRMQSILKMLKSISEGAREMDGFCLRLTQLGLAGFTLQNPSLFGEYGEE